MFGIAVFAIVYVVLRSWGRRAARSRLEETLALYNEALEKIIANEAHRASKVEYRAKLDVMDSYISATQAERHSNN